MGWLSIVGCMLDYKCIGLESRYIFPEIFLSSGFKVQPVLVLEPAAGPVVTSNRSVWGAGEGKAKLTLIFSRPRQRDQSLALGPAWAAYSVPSAKGLRPRGSLKLMVYLEPIGRT